MFDSQMRQSAKSLALLLLLLLLVACSSASPETAAAPSVPAGTSTPVPTFAVPGTWTPDPAIPTPVSIPTATPTLSPVPPSPVPTLSPLGALEAALESELGSSNRDVERVVRVEKTAGINTLFVDWNINDAFTDDMQNAGVKIDIAAMMRTIEQSEGIEYEDIALSGFFPLVDVLGNVTDTRVVQVWYDRSTLEQINWDNFLHKNVFAVAKTVRLHPAFEE